MSQEDAGGVNFAESLVAGHPYVVSPVTKAFASGLTVAGKKCSVESRWVTVQRGRLPFPF